MLYGKASSLGTNANASLNTIQNLNAQQYIDSSVSPLLSRCNNYTAMSNVLAASSKSALTQSQEALTGAQTISTSIVNIAISINNVPSIDQSRLTPIYDNLLRVRQAYTMLGIADSLARLRSGIEAAKIASSNYRSKIASLKMTIDTYKKMYSSLEKLSCNSPSQTP